MNYGKNIKQGEVNMEDKEKLDAAIFLLKSAREQLKLPYYKFNKAKIGLDVGGILYEIIRSTKLKNQGGNPTIMPGR